MLSLESVDLSYNSLTGSILKSLEANKYLRLFNVSHNELTGEIPSGGPFANFTSQSFMFNEGLCGDPRFQVPPCPKITSRKSEKKKVVLIAVIIPISIFLALTLTLVFTVMRFRRRGKKIPATQEASLNVLVFSLPCLFVCNFIIF